jgi:hypothetical protein
MKMKSALATKSNKAPLVFAALLEASTGMALLIAPSLLASILIGAPLHEPSGLVVARVAGVALLSLGLACWLARNHGTTHSARDLLMAMALYNAGTFTVLVYARVGLGLTGIGLWPAALLHFALAVWCVASTRISES